jgi:cephalosporin-C deacetylase-like acetyl esterase
MKRLAILPLALAALLPLDARPARAEGHHGRLSDLWTPEVLAKVRDGATLNLEVIPRDGYSEVFFDSEIGDAKWADSEEPYAVHTGDTVRIHGYLASPAAGGPYPALVVGHGHGGHGDPDTARLIAGLGYVVLSIDGPRAGLSTGGPQDTEQAWISVEEEINRPSPEVGYLYHYAYAGMRALTLFQHLSAQPGNPFRIDGTRLGVVGASMGGQFTYYVNGVDDRVKAAVAIAVAGDWHHELFYEGGWLYHGLYYYTRDGVRSGQDALNTIASVCTDPTLDTFRAYFDPMAYAPTQHGPLLTIMGTHDQYFTVPAVNTTYDRVRSAGTSPRFLKRIELSANGTHPVVDSDRPLKSVLEVLGSADRWLRYAFQDGPAPPETPTARADTVGDWIVLSIDAHAGATPLRAIELFYATQMDSQTRPACDFSTVPLFGIGGGRYVGFLPLGWQPRCGPAVQAANLLFYASVHDQAGYTISSKLYDVSGPLEFCNGFAPRLSHFPGDDFPVPPVPEPNCACACGGEPGR